MKTAQYTADWLCSLKHGIVLDKRWKTTDKAPIGLRAVPLFSYSRSRAERKKTGRAKVGRTKAVVWAKGEKKGTTDKASAFDLSRPSDFMVFISNLINRNPTISLSWRPVNFGLSSLSSLSSISQSHFCIVGTTHKSNAEALSVVPFFFAFRPDNSFRAANFCAACFFCSALDGL